MNRFPKAFLLFAPVCFGLIFSAKAQAQISDEAHKEFPLVAKVSPTGEELSAQPRMWMMEVHLKPMRMITVTLANPQTGKPQVENIWYIVFKAINRPLPFKEDTSNTVPINDNDQEPLERMFAPVFTLRTDDITNGKPVQHTYQDEIIPAAQAAINARESFVDPETGKRVLYQNSVEIIQPLPTETPEDQGDANAIYGMAMWRGVDRNTDYFTIYMTGFSNAYRYVNDPISFDQLKQLAKDGDLLPGDGVWDGAADIRTASEICNWKASIKAQTDQIREWKSAGSVGGLMDDVKIPPEDARDRLWYYTKTADRYPRDKRPPVWRRAIVQHFSRFGDQVDESEKEFRACLEPHWLYLPDDAKPAAPGNVAPNPAGGNVTPNSGTGNVTPNPGNVTPNPATAPANNN